MWTVWSSGLFRFCSIARLATKWRAPLIAYAVEQKGVALDESVVLADGFAPRADAVACLTQRYGREHTQALYGMGASLCRRQHSYEVDDLREIADDGLLCVAAYAAMFWTRDRDREPALSCACASCRGADGQRPLRDPPDDARARNQGAKVVSACARNTSASLPSPTHNTSKRRTNLFDGKKKENRKN